MKQNKLKKQTIMSLKDAAYAEIKRAILNNDFPPGSKLNESEISGQLGISRGPVREALRQLDSDGLVHSEPYKGSVVSQRSDEEAAQVYTPIRRIIEGYACNKASQIFTDDDYIALNTMIDDLKEACHSHDFESASSIDETFHRYIVSRCTSDMLTSLWNSLSAQFHGRIFFQNRVKLMLPAFEKVPDEHLEMLSAIKSGDPELIEKIMIAHIK